MCNIESDWVHERVFFLICNIIVDRKSALQHACISDRGRCWERVSVNGVSYDRRGHMAVDQWWVKCVEVHRLGTQELCAVSSRILLSSHQVKGCKALLGTHLENQSNFENTLLHLLPSHHLLAVIPLKEKGNL